MDNWRAVLAWLDWPEDAYITSKEIGSYVPELVQWLQNFKPPFPYRLDKEVYVFQEDEIYKLLFYLRTKYCKFQIVVSPKNSGNFIHETPSYGFNIHPALIVPEGEEALEKTYEFSESGWQQCIQYMAEVVADDVKRVKKRDNRWKADD